MRPSVTGSLVIMAGYEREPETKTKPRVMASMASRCLILDDWYQQLRRFGPGTVARIPLAWVVGVMAIIRRLIKLH